MKRSFLFLTFTLLVSTILLSACSGSSGVAGSWPGVTADQDMAYLAYNAHIYGIDLAGRKEAWRFPDKPQNNLSFHAAPVLTNDGQLLAGSYGPAGYNLYSLNPANGQVNWTFEDAQNNYITSPLVTVKGIYAPNSDGKLYALDFQGHLLWTFETQKPLWATPATNDQCDCIFLAGMDHMLYALNAETGDEIWKSNDLGGAMVATPTFSADGMVYIGTFANEMLAVNSKTGEINWRYHTENWLWSQATLLDQILYFGDSSGNLYALDAGSGKEIWKVKIEGKIVSEPLVLNGKIYFTAGTDQVFAYTLDGVSVWQQKLLGSLHGAVVAAGNNLLVAPMNNENALFMLNESGAQQWAFVPEK